MSYTYNNYMALSLDSLSGKVTINLVWSSLLYMHFMRYANVAGQHGTLSRHEITYELDSTLGTSCFGGSHEDCMRLVDQDWQALEAADGARPVVLRRVLGLCPGMVRRERLGPRGCARAAHRAHHRQQRLPPVAADEPGERCPGNGGDAGVTWLYRDQA